MDTSPKTVRQEHQGISRCSDYRRGPQWTIRLSSDTIKKKKTLQFSEQGSQKSRIRRLQTIYACGAQVLSLKTHRDTGTQPSSVKWKVKQGKRENK